jgi:hypothetical protein
MVAATECARHSRHTSYLRRALVVAVFVVVAGTAAVAADGASLTKSGGLYLPVRSSAPRVSPEEPVAIAALSDGGLAIADDARNEILERAPSGSYAVIAGTGSAGLTGDGGPAVRAEVNQPSSLLATSSGAVYFVQRGLERSKSVSLVGSISSVIREVAPSGSIRTLAGLHPACPSRRGAGSIPAESALMYSPELSIGPGGVIEVSTTVCPAISLLGPYVELTSAGGLTDNAPDRVAAASVNCSDVTVGAGFLAFVCDSGGGAVGEGHPKELLVVRANGSTKAYPAWRGGLLAAGHGEVIAAHNDSLVRVTSQAITTLVSDHQLDSLVSDASGVAEINGITISHRGDIFMTADLYRHGGGCGAVIVERAASGTLEKLWSAASRLCY